MTTDDYGRDEVVADELGLVEGPPAWPKVIGGIGIGYSAVQLGCVGCGVVGLLSGQLFASAMQQAFPDGMPPAMQTPPVMIWVSLVFSTLVVLFLMIAAITLVLRKPVARPLHLLYAALAIVAALFGLWANMQYQAEIAQWVSQNPNTKFAQQQRQGGMVGQIVGWVVGLFFGFAWPLFCIVWFGAVKKDSSEIATGSEQLM